MQGKQPGSASPSRSQQEGTEAALVCPVALPTTEGLKLLSYASVMLSFLWSFLSASPEMGEQMRAHRATRIRATQWALSIIITIMIYKKNYFSGNCVKLLFRSGEGGGTQVPAKTFLEGG